MLPDPRSPKQAHYRRLQPLRLTAIALALCAPGVAATARAQSAEAAPGLADDPAPPVAIPAPSASANAKPASNAADSTPVGFEADKVDYDDNGQLVTATGNVVLRHETQSTRADKVTWNRDTGVIIATGNVRLVDKDGNLLFTQRIQLTQEFQAGAMDSMLLALREGGRIAAESGTRDDNGKVVLSHAAYTACRVEDGDGCPKHPTWRVTATRVVYYGDTKRVTFSHARLELFHTIAIPMFGLGLNTDGAPSSGVLIPTFQSTPSNGIQIDGSYYWHISDTRDLTGTVSLFTKSAPMVSAQFRAITDLGSFQITAYGTSSRRLPIDATSVNDQTGTGDYAFRGYIFANGKLQLSPHWSVTASIRRTTDDTFLLRYDISRDDRLRSVINVERIDANSYLTIAGWATQTLRINDSQGQTPIALPVIDYRYRLPQPILGGKVELEANTLAITRTEGQDTQRAFVRAQWDMRRVTPWGQVVTLTGMLRGDLYHSSHNDLTDTVSYQGNPGWETRGVAIGAIDVTWPLVGAAFGGTQVLTPHIQFVASPHIKNLAIPDEDSRAIDLTDSDLFSLNRFPGYDRIEDGARFTYGLDYQLQWPSWQINATIGQSYRFSSQPTLSPVGTGLSDRTSDIVGRIDVKFRDFITFTDRFRIDKSSGGLRRNELDATIGDHKNYLEVGYTNLDRGIQELEDLPDREELRGAGRFTFLKYWSVYGSAVLNLTSRADDPINGSDGFQPLRTRVGIEYSDDCFEIGFSWRRDYVTLADAKQGNAFLLHLAIKNLGSH